MAGLTKQDLIEMEQRLTEAAESREQRLTGNLRREFAGSSENMRNSLIEAMRDMQSELLRGFEAFAAPQGTRLRKLEVDTEETRNG